MCYYELLITITLNKNISFNDANEELSKLINCSMAKDPYLLELHKRKGYKFYSFSSLYPTEKDKIYKTGKEYIFRLRSTDSEFVCAIQYYLKTEFKNCNIKVISVNVIKKNQNFINKLITITPTIITSGEDTSWQVGEDIEILKNKLHNNLKYKYNNFYNVDIQAKEHFFYGIKVLNGKPIFTNYKSGFLIGNKLEIYIKEDEVSQKLATMALSCGLGEKNSIGMGFCYAW